MSGSPSSAEASSHPASEASSPPTAADSPIDAATKEAESIVRAFHTEPREEGKFEELKPKTIEDDDLKEELLDETIKKLHINADSWMAIKRYKSTDTITVPGSSSDPAKTEPVVIRDASATPTGIKYDDLEETYQLSMTSTARGALAMVDMSGNTEKEKNAMKEAIMKDLKDSFKLTKKDKNGNDVSIESVSDRIKHVRAFEKAVLKTMFDNRIDIEGVERKSDLAKMLADTRDMCNLRDEQPHLATVFEGYDGDKRTTVSVRVAPFSKALKRDFRIIKDNLAIITASTKTQKDVLKELKESKSCPELFKGLKPRQQTLIIANIDKLIEGDKTVATSLRFIPGLRNAFVEAEFCTYTKEGGKSETTCYDKSIRTGTIAYTQEKGTSQTRQNADHLKSIAEGEIKFQMYNHDFSDEAAIVSKTKEVLDKHELEHISMQTTLDKGSAFQKIREAASTKDRINIFSCKSGKDRTEMGRRVAKHQAYIQHLGTRGVVVAGLSSTVSKGDVSTQRDISEKVITSGHGANISGGYGGNHGSLGLKTGAMLKFIFTDLVVSFSKGAKDLIRGELIRNKVSKLNKIETPNWFNNSKIKKPLAQGRV
jgi:hypothetical protein